METGKDLSTPIFISIIERHRGLYEIDTMSMGKIRRYIHVQVSDKGEVPTLGVLGMIWIRCHEDSEDKAVGTSNEMWHSCYARKVGQRRGYQNNCWLSSVAFLVTTHATSVAVETFFMTCFCQAGLLSLSNLFFFSK